MKSCSLCGCPEDDAYENSDGGVSCLCGVDIEDVDPEDVVWGFHLVNIETDEGWIE